MATAAEPKLLTAEEFNSHARWPRSKVNKGLLPVPPDFIADVVSSGNRSGETLRKIGEHLEIGVPLAWMLYPRRRSIVLYRSDDRGPIVLGQGDVLENLPELPGFRCPVADFFV